MPHYLYNTIPGAHPTWTLAVLAVSQSDADAFMKRHHRGGKRAGKATESSVRADCGAITSEMEQRLAREMYREMEEFKKEAALHDEAQPESAVQP